MSLRAARGAARLARTARRRPANPARRPAAAAAACGARLMATKSKFDPQDFIAQHAEAMELMEHHRADMERLIPTEYAELVQVKREADATVARIDDALARGDDKEFAKIGDEIRAELDRDLAELVAQAKESVAAKRDDYREFIWARQALEEGRTAEAYGVHPDAGAIGSAGVLEKYGVTSVVSSLAVIAIAKGIYLPNEETLVVACFSGFIFAGYVALREQVTADLDEQSAEQIKEQRSGIEKYIGAIRLARDFFQDSRSIATEMANVAANYAELERKYVETRPRHFRAELVRQIEAGLARLANQEQTFVQSIPGTVADAVTGAVTERLGAASDADKQADLDAAIARVGGGAASGRDAVREEYNNVLSRTIERWAAVRDTTLNVPQGVSDALKPRYDAELSAAMSDMPELPAEEELTKAGVVLPAGAYEMLKGVSKRLTDGFKVPKQLRMTY